MVRHGEMRILKHLVAKLEQTLSKLQGQDTARKGVTHQRDKVESHNAILEGKKRQREEDKLRNGKTKEGKRMKA